VRPTSAVERLSTSIETTEIARRIDVDTILTGTYLKAGDRFRVNTQLVDVHPNEILWREQFDVPFGDILALQDRITEKIVSGLNISLSTEEKENLHAETPRSLTAYELYLRAKDHGEGVEGFKNAIELLKQSLELDPSYAPAWAELADCHLMIAFGGLGGRDHYIEAENAARRALDLNQGLLAAHFVLLAAYGQTGRVTESMQTCLTLLHAAPSSEFTHLGLGHLYEYNGELDRALRAFNRARRINPIHLTTFTQAAAIYLQRGEDEKALQFLTNDVCQEHECGTKAYLLGVLAFRAGDRDTAYRHFSTSARVDNRSIFGRLSLGAQLKLEGNKDAGLAILEEVSGKVTSGDWLFFLAHPFIMAFNRGDRALDLLEQALDLGYCNLEGLERDPAFEPIREEPRYRVLIERARALKADRQPLLDQLMELENRLSTFYSGTDSL
jgi:adenylate cyclase